MEIYALYLLWKHRYANTQTGLLSNTLTTNHKSTYLKGFTDQQNEGLSTQGKWVCLTETNTEDSDEVKLFSVRIPNQGNLSRNTVICLFSSQWWNHWAKMKKQYLWYKYYIKDCFEMVHYIENINWALWLHEYVFCFHIKKSV